MREGLLSATFGASSELDTYFAAFRIPDLVYNILIAGGIIVAFLPLFSEYLSKNEKEAWELTNNILNVFLALLIFLCVVLFIFTPALLKFVVPGFNLQQIALATILTRLMLFSPILLGLSAIFSGVLQHFNRFLVYGLCPILYNLGIIFGIIFLTPSFGIFGVAVGVILGALLHFLIQIPPAIICGFKYKPIFNLKHPGIKRIFVLMVPRTFGIAVQQINLIIITAIASTLVTGSITIFNFANNLQYLPIGIIGISFAVAAFPKLAQNWVKGDKEEFIENFSSVFRKVLYLIIPLSLLMFILKTQIVNIILRHGQFDLASAQLTSVSLGLFCFGIFALSLIPLIFRAFFAFQDTKTPTLISIAGMILNVILSFYFVWLLSFSNIFYQFMTNTLNLQRIENIQVLGLPLAFTIAGIFQFILLMIFLYKKIGDYRLREIFNSFLKIFFASVLMSFLVYFVLLLTSPIFNSQTFFGAFWQLAIAGSAGTISYIVFTFLLKAPEITMIKPLILNLKKFNN